MTTTLTHQSTLREVQSEHHGVLRYHEFGDGPPLLLLHGSGPGVTGWRNYRGVLEDLARQFRCLVLEFPGFGVSDAGEGHPFSMAISAVPDFLQVMNLSKVDVIGNSMGGGVALQVALTRPDLLGRIVAIGGIGRSVLSPSPGEGIRLLIEFTDNPSRETLRRWLVSMVYDPALVTDELLEERWNLATDPETLTIARRMYSSEAMARMVEAQRESAVAPYWSQLDKITAPVLVTWGRDDRVSPLDMGLIAMRDLPNGEFHVFPKCGHWTMIEARDAWVSSVTAFLTRNRNDIDA